MKNTYLQNLYDAMPEIFTSPLLYKEYVDFLIEKYTGQTEFEFDEDDLDTIGLICHKELGTYSYDDDNNEVIDIDEWAEFEKYTINFIKNIIINNNK